MTSEEEANDDHQQHQGGQSPPPQAQSQKNADNNDDDDHGDILNYFAIGSMMNPTSLSLRNIHPTCNSRPAELLNYELKFFGPMGFAEAVPVPPPPQEGSSTSTSSFHGVIHTVTLEEMKRLNDIEGHLYHQQKAKAKLYSETTTKQDKEDEAADRSRIVDVIVYVRRNDLPENSGCYEEIPPQERYLDIMIQGAQYYGISQEYITWLRNHPKQPRPLPSEFLSFGPIPTNSDGSVKTMTLQDIEPYDGNDGNKPVYIALNGKVLEILDETPSKVGLTLKMRREGHVCCELWIPKIVYDPKYGIPKSLEECSNEYMAYLEHMTVQRVGIHGCRVVAKLDLSR